jgi:hypothetical protein
MMAARYRAYSSRDRIRSRSFVRVHRGFFFDFSYANARSVWHIPMIA